MESFKQFLSHYPLETFEKGQIILLGGDQPRGVYVVESGLVKTYVISPSGEEQLITIDGRDAQVPVGYAVGVIDKSEYYYEAYDRCRLRVVPREDYDRHLQTNIESLYVRHVRMAILLVSMFERVQTLEQPLAGSKVARTLLYMSNRVGSLFGANSSKIQVKTTQQEIANLLGISRETTNAELKKLELKKIITRSRKNYTLYTQKIKKYLGDRDQ